MGLTRLASPRLSFVFSSTRRFFCSTRMTKIQLGMSSKTADIRIFEIFTAVVCFVVRRLAVNSIQCHAIQPFFDMKSLKAADKTELQHIRRSHCCHCSSYLLSISSKIQISMCVTWTSKSTKHDIDDDDENDMESREHAKGRNVKMLFFFGYHRRRERENWTAVNIIVNL